MNVKDLNNAEMAGKAAWLEAESKIDLDWNAPSLKRMARIEVGVTPPEVMALMAPDQQMQAAGILGGE